LSLTTTVKNGSTLSTEDNIMILAKGGNKTRFTRKIAAGEGNSMTLKIIPQDMEQAHAATNQGAKTMDLNDLHRLCGHAG
jgi:hypothetical protein